MLVKRCNMLHRQLLFNLDVCSAQQPDGILAVVLTNLAKLIEYRPLFLLLRQSVSLQDGP